MGRIYLLPRLQRLCDMCGSSVVMNTTLSFALTCVRDPYPHLFVGPSRSLKIFGSSFGNADLRAVVSFISDAFQACADLRRLRNVGKLLRVGSQIYNLQGSPNWTNLQEPNYLFTIRGGGDRRLVNTHTENMAPHLNAVQRRELAVEKARQNQYEEALQYLNAADTLQPNDAVTLRYRGEILRVLCRFDEALQDLSQAVDLETKDAYARWSRGDTLSRLGRYNEALSDLNQAVILDPNDARARCSRGETLRVLRRFDKALQDLNMAVNQEPNHAPARARKL
eukprot:jgi/Botrbrau1/3035/Bobra.0070s0031.1